MQLLLDNPETHIIARQSYRFRVPPGEDPARIRQLCNDEIPEALNTLFDRYCGAGQVVRIPKLELRLELAANETEASALHNFKSALIAAVEAVLREQQADQPTPLHEAAAAAVLHFLRHGVYPWYIPKENTASFFETAPTLDAPTFEVFVRHASAAASRSAASRLRLIELLSYHLDRITAPWLNLPVAEAAGLLRELGGPGKESVPTELRRTIATALTDAASQGTDPGARRAAFLRLAAAYGLQEHGPAAPPAGQHPDQPAAHLTHAQQAADRSGSTDHPGSLQEKAQERQQRATSTSNGDRPIDGSEHIPAPDGPGPQAANAPQDPERSAALFSQVPPQRIRVANAGLVLLAPFLPQLFDTLGLVHENTLGDPGRAIAVLRCCTFGDIPGTEDEFVLEKILCGLEPADSTGLLPEIAARERAECVAMLEAVIGNWPVLRQTSPDGLRQSFLQREALLDRRDGDWKLRVQRQAHDVLLDFIPWSFAIIRTPWMKNLLFVDWTA